MGTIKKTPEKKGVWATVFVTLLGKWRWVHSPPIIIYLKM